MGVLETSWIFLSVKQWEPSDFCSSNTDTVSVCSCNMDTVCICSSNTDVVCFAIVTRIWFVWGSTVTPTNNDHDGHKP